MDTFLNTIDRKVLKYLSIFLLILSVFFAIKVLSEIKEYRNIGKGIYPSSVITVNGKGEVFVKPDVASFNFSVNESGKTSKEAQDKATNKTNKIISAIKGLDVEDKDIKTLSYNINPEYDYSYSLCKTDYCPPSNPVIKGYQVSQTIEVKVRKIEKAGDVLAKVGELSVSYVSGLNFVVDDMTKLKMEAREEAIKDAKKQAQALAKNLGVKLKKITSFYDNSDTMYPPYYAEGMGGAMMSKADMRTSPEIPTGENKITANVSITYEID
jgi:uncharacterized protein YggE